MKVSVIIPALNEAPRIVAAVQSAWAAGADEVIVADGGGSDSTAELAEPIASCVVRAAAGRGVQQNAGARAATGEVLLFLHADTQLEEGAIEQIRQALQEQPQRQGGAFRQRILAARWIYRWLEWGNGLRVSWRGLPYGDQGLFFRRAFFQELGEFPEVPLMEDLILMRSFRRRVWPLLLPGPLYVSARRWEKHGVVRQTLRNWLLLAAFHIGVSPQRLARFYRRHDLNKQGATSPQNDHEKSC